MAETEVLAISSGGGHWLELLRIRDAFQGSRVAWATVNEGYRGDVGDAPFYSVPDATRWNRLRLLWLAVRVFFLVLKLRPRVVVSTGAAPGYLAIRAGKFFGAKTIWLDSFANIDELSLSGRLAGRCADLWLTQWPELARPEGPRYVGGVFDLGEPEKAAGRPEPEFTGASA